jgi:hypothetical protein
MKPEEEEVRYSVGKEKKPTIKGEEGSEESKRMEESPGKMKKTKIASFFQKQG